MNRNYLSKLLLKSGSLFITTEGYAAAMMDCFPVVLPGNPSPGAFFFSEPPTYKELATKALKQLQQSISVNAETERIILTDEFASEELPEDSIAYHRVWGFVTANSSWYFSSKQLEQDLRTAETNPAITCHFLHVNTPGGEAWYLDELSKAMRTMQKPILVLIEQYCCSAGYYIACHSSHIYALTQNDNIGCIGTMTDFYDFEGYYAQLGIKRIKEKSHYSDLKNKKFDDLRDGKPEQYITEDLDPLTEQFITEVRNCRSSLQALPEDDPVFRGETFNTPSSIASGLIDGQSSLLEAITRAYQLGKDYSATESLKKRALNFV